MDTCVGLMDVDLSKDFPSLILLHEMFTQNFHKVRERRFEFRVEIRSIKRVPEDQYTVAWYLERIGKIFLGGSSR